jgi:hypothetical protein
MWRHAPSRACGQRQAVRTQAAVWDDGLVHRNAPHGTTYRSGCQAAGKCLKPKCVPKHTMYSTASTRLRRSDTTKTEGNRCVEWRSLTNTYYQEGGRQEITNALQGRGVEERDEGGIGKAGNDGFICHLFRVRAGGGGAAAGWDASTVLPQHARGPTGAGSAR